MIIISKIELEANDWIFASFTFQFLTEIDLYHTLTNSIWKLDLLRTSHATPIDNTKCDQLIILLQQIIYILI